MRLGELVEKLTKQRLNIDALRTHGNLNLDLQPLKIPPNPITETNDRLMRIEERLEQALDIAVNAAEIATELQKHAATFLEKFEKAASDNDRSAAGAIRLGKYAVLIAVITFVLQIVYTETWRAPQDSASVEAAIVAIQSEMTELRQTARQGSEQIVAALERANLQMLEVLQDVAPSPVDPSVAPTEETAPPVVPIAKP